MWDDILQMTGVLMLTGLMFVLIFWETMGGGKGGDLP